MANSNLASKGLCLLFKIENLVLPPGCRSYPTGRKLGQVRDARLSHRSNLFMVSGVPPEGGPPAKKTAGLIEKETNSSPQSSQRTLRKTIVNNLCDLCVLCSEILIGNGIGSREVSYKDTVPTFPDTRNL